MEPTNQNILPNAAANTEFVKTPTSLSSKIGSFAKNYFMVIGILSTFVGVVFTLILISAMSSISDKAAGMAVENALLAEGKNMVLHIKLEGPIKEESISGDRAIIAQMFGNESGIYLPRLRSYLRVAKNDPKVLGLFIEFGGISGSLADFTELRNILEEFKASEKQIYSWFSIGSNKTLYLASVGQHISLSPVGDITIPGPVFNLMYFGEAIRKLGVGMEVVRSGKYKSAFEPFIKNKPSPATIEMYDAMEASIRNHLVEVIGKGRLGKTASTTATVNGWFKKSTFTTKEALEAGIVDALAYREEAIEVMEKALGVKKVDFSDYKSGRDTGSHGLDVATTDDYLGLIEAIGEIRMDGGDDDSGITPGNMHEKLQWAMDEESVKAVVLRVSSPGGSAIASDLIWRDVERLAAIKPVVVSMGAYAASGGYYISAPASKIVAQPTTITGSIGVIGMMPNLSEFESKYGISFHTITNSDRKSMLDQGAPLNSADREIISKSIDETYDTFVRKVASGRSKTQKEIDDIAQGRVWTGAQALEIGLVDRLGGMPEAYQEAKKLAGLDENLLYNIKKFERKKLNLMECLKNARNMGRCLNQGGVKIKSLIGFFTETKMEPMDPILKKIEGISAIMGKQKIQAIWPGYLFLDQEK